MRNKVKQLELKLENIGHIKEANIDISGLTVIAGKNDEGKSTVGKALMAVIKAQNMANVRLDDDKSKNIELLCQKSLNTMIKLIFNSEISHKGKISLNEVDSMSNYNVKKKEYYGVSIKSNKCDKFNLGNEKKFIDCALIQTPLIWDLMEFFDTILRMRQNSFLYGSNSKQLDVKYPYLLWDLFMQISDDDSIYEDLDGYITDDIKSQIIKIIGGRFIKEQGKPYRFYPTSGKSISLHNTAVGIKSWGVMQLLLDKNRFVQQRYFVFDEPENHLHPTWQIEFAKVLVILAKNNIRIMVNTHSPYMLGGLRTHSKKQNCNTKFYLADNGIIKQVNDNNDDTLDEIFDKLHEAYTTLDEIEGNE